MTLNPPRIARSRFAAFLVLALAVAPGYGAEEQARTASLPAAAAPATSTAGAAALLEINGAIGPATSHYVVRGLEAAHDSGARLVILEIDTPGEIGRAHV